MNPALEFEATMQIIGVNPYVSVTADQAQTLHPGWRKPMPVVVQINGKPDTPWHINMMPKGNGDFYLYLSNEVRQASQTKVGDTVTVSVWFDSEYQSGPVHPLPPSFQQGLEESIVAQQNWNRLPPSRQKEVLRYFAGLKSAEALERNVVKVLHALNGNATHIMGRDWTDGK